MPQNMTNCILKPTVTAVLIFLLTGGFTATGWTMEVDEAGIPIRNEKTFDCAGHIDRIEAMKEIVIDDSLYRLSSMTHYFSATTGQSIPPSRFQIGDLAGFTKNTEGGILSLWLIQKGKELKDRYQPSQP